MAARNLFTLFVSNIPYKSTKEDLQKVFEAFKPVSARIITERRMGSVFSRGIGFVDFASEEDSTKALGGEFLLEGRKLYTNKARPPRERDTAFVRGIPAGTKKEDLMAAFAKFNPKDAKVVKEDAEGVVGFGFVLFAPADLAGAVKANEKFTLNGKEATALIAKRRFNTRPRRALGRRGTRRAPRKEKKETAEPAKQP